MMVLSLRLHIIPHARTLRKRTPLYDQINEHDNSQIPRRQHLTVGEPQFYIKDRL